MEAPEDAPAGIVVVEDLEPDLDTTELILLTFPTPDVIFRDLLSNVFLLSQEEEKLNDVSVICQDNEVVLAPSFLLASVCPVFKVHGGHHAPDQDKFSLVLPEVSAEDFRTFLSHVCKLDTKTEATEEGGISALTVSQELLDDLEILQGVLDVVGVECRDQEDLVEMESLLLLDPDWNQIDVEDPKADKGKENISPAEVEVAPPKRKLGRKRKEEKSAKPEPYVKTEVMETNRTETSYGLRRTIKRKRFADEVSDPSDLDSDGGDISSVNSDDYQPDPNEQAQDVDIEDSESEDEEDDLNIETLEMEEVSKGEGNPDENYDEEEEDESEMLSTFTVKMGTDGQVELINQEEAKKDDASSIGRVIAVMEGDEDIDFKGKKLLSSNSNPRSLLKTSAPTPLVLFCSVCEGQFKSMNELKHHVAKEHKGSNFFLLPPADNPHRDCAQCKSMMGSYEEMVASDPELATKDICFPCPHCRRRFLGQFGALASHLASDHRHAAAGDLGDLTESYFAPLRAGDAKALQCDFCSQEFAGVAELNQHLIACPENTSGHSAGLHCHVCGKMFAQARHLKDHLFRHGKDKLSRPRTHYCQQCPVACVSEAALEKHVEKEHSEVDEESFKLHEGCERCSAMYDSYLENKATGAIPSKDLAFKCPHCFMLLYAHQKHAPRYLFNHVSKWHADAEINDFTLGEPGSEEQFKVLSRFSEECLRCHFCGEVSASRADYNSHLNGCALNTVPCKPAYLCESCNFICSTSKELRLHLDSHRQEEVEVARPEHACHLCSYVGKSERFLKRHLKVIHGRRAAKRRKMQEAAAAAAAGGEPRMVNCPKCGKEKKDNPAFKVHVKKCGTGPARVKCTECDMEFKRREDMQAHALIHYGHVTCPIHNILFKQESEVFQHVNQAGPGEKAFRLQCCMCEASFRHMCLFMKHMRRHLRIQAYRCGICQKHFNTFASLTVHQANIHNAAPVKRQPRPVRSRLFNCTQCSKSFGTKGHLQEHINGVHMRNAVPCHVCNKTFNTVKRMKKHLFHAHKDIADSYRSQTKVEEFVDLPMRAAVVE